VIAGREFIPPKAPFEEWRKGPGFVHECATLPTSPRAAPAAKVRDDALREGDHPQDGGGASATPVRPEPVEGRAGEDRGSTSSPRTEQEAEAGMAQMSEKFREIGSELYIGAAGREHD